MQEHIVTSYDTELEMLGQKIAEMGGIAEKMLVDAMEALATLDGPLAKATVSTDISLDKLQRDIEDQVVLTIAKRQPMAIDLRQLIGAMRVAGDLERVGDLAKNIAKRSIQIGNDSRIPSVKVSLRHMGETAARQLKNTLDAYASRDQEMAKEVWLRDAELDAVEENIFRELLTFMMEDPRNISYCTHLLFCSKNIERIGDHATNIAETIHYIATGDSLPIERPKSIAEIGSITVV
ncbi:MAG: phosphate signaling complex protein PhoU [Beijerinckiaceae bacterium]|jgi:phosphate transport system protein|nr:phosphate signaling complex protein PhoU [Beijerinckiaceae bacterium]